jgi:succinoglycan biosynthesis transport protein ExoP
VRPAQFTIREIIALFRFRKKFLIIPAIIVTLLSGIGSMLLPNKYESSTTILVQRDEILNPLISYEMAVTMASEDRLRTFNEIIYSRTTLQRLIDTLGLSKDVHTEAQRQALVDAVEHNITTERRGSDSFRITYIDTDPVRAQQAAELLAHLFIETILRVEGQRNELTVQFFEKKLDELRQKFEVSQRKVVSSLQQRINTMPTETRGLYTQLETLEKQRNDLDTKINTYQQELVILRTFPDALHTESGKQSLYDLQRADIPFIADLKTLLAKYDDYLRRYTPKYPEVEKTEQQLAALLDRMHGALESELIKLQPQQQELERRHSRLVDDIRNATVNQRVDEDKESDYGIYHKLYDEMKVKLEQAQTTRDLGRKGANQFIILDPALVPTKPSKPNRSQIVFGGFGLGLFLGFLTVIFKEMLDTTVRIPRDIEVYQKPVIAFISDGENDRLN